jgi:hypothetical protein
MCIFFAVTFQLLWNRLAIASQSMCNRLSITLLSPRKWCVIASQSLGNDHTIELQSLRTRFAIASQSLRNHFRIASQSLRNHHSLLRNYILNAITKRNQRKGRSIVKRPPSNTIALRSIYNRFAVTLQSTFNRLAFSLQSPCNRFATAFQMLCNPQSHRIASQLHSQCNIKKTWRPRKMCRSIAKRPKSDNNLFAIALLWHRYRIAIALLTLSNRPAIALQSTCPYGVDRCCDLIYCNPNSHLLQSAPNKHRPATVLPAKGSRFHNRKIHNFP